MAHSCLATEQSRAYASQFHHSRYSVSRHALPFRSPSGVTYRLKKGFPLRPRYPRLCMQVVAQDSNARWEREEARWLREEERWKREEQRWLREEKRWDNERENLLLESARMRDEIKCLKEEIQRLQAQGPERQESSYSLRDVVIGLKGLLQSLSTMETTESKPATAKIPAIPGNGPASEASASEQSAESIKFILPIPDPPKPEASKAVDTDEARAPARNDGSSSKEQRTLKLGAEGDDVKMLQEALAKLGFYSGEDDMEYSYFSSGTDRAVKSWQASTGAAQNGIVAAHVLAQLVNEQGIVTVNSSTVVTSTPEEVRETNLSDTRVYLLGENRWEDPARLLHRRRETVTTAQKCFTCKGEGRTLCSECEGTGELNVEEQFLEWAGEGAKCPYCEGSGTLICDDCGGKGVAAN